MFADVYTLDQGHITKFFLHFFREKEKYLPCAPKALILNLHTAAYWQKTHKPHRSCNRETQAHRLQTVLLKKHKHQ